MQPDIAALLLVGSHAQGLARPGSDIDLVLLADDPARYLADTAWTARFGDAASAALEDYGALQSLRVCYAAGIEAEFGLARPGWLALPLDPGTAEVLAGGCAVLHDPRGLAAQARHI
jgi:hypothetical protein